MQADNKPDPGVAETISTSAATEGNLFRLVDATTGTYMFNLSTKSGFTSGGVTTAFTSQGTYKLSARTAKWHQLLRQHPTCEVRR